MFFIFSFLHVHENLYVRVEFINKFFLSFLYITNVDQKLIHLMIILVINV
jgi:hypothetical protein